MCIAIDNIYITDCRIYNKQGKKFEELYKCPIKNVAEPVVWFSLLFLPVISVKSTVSWVCDRCEKIEDVTHIHTYSRSEFKGENIRPISNLQ